MKVGFDFPFDNNNARTNLSGPVCLLVLQEFQILLAPPRDMSNFSTGPHHPDFGTKIPNILALSQLLLATHQLAPLPNFIGKF